MRRKKTSRQANKQRKHASKQAGRRASRQASKQEANREASKQAGRQTSRPARKQVSKQYLSNPGRHTASSTSRFSNSTHEVSREGVIPHSIYVPRQRHGKVSRFSYKCVYTCAALARQLNSSSWRGPREDYVHLLLFEPDHNNDNNT